MSNDTQTLSLTDFLLARIAKDEEWLRASARQIAVHPTRQQEPARMLVDCEAKRRIVEGHSPSHVCPNLENDGFTDYGGPEEWAVPCPTLRVLALPYADHPDYRPEWRA